MVRKIEESELIVGPATTGPRKVTLDEIIPNAEPAEASVLSSAGRAVTDLGLSGLEGATFGFSPELAGAGMAAVGQGDVAGNIQQAEARMDEIDPVLRTVGNIAGATGTTLATRGLGLIPAAGGASIGRLAAAGALEGGLAGAGFAEGGLEDRALGAAVGAGTGGVLGGLSKPITSGFTRLGRALFRGSPRTQAMRRVAQSLEREGLSVDQAQARLGRLGERGVLADVGENLARQARGAASTPGPAATRAANVLNQRSALGSIPRIQRVVRGALSDTDFNRTVDDVIERRATTATPLYQAAGIDDSATPRLVQSEAIDNLLRDSRDIQQAIRQARRFPEFKNLPDNDIRLLDQAYKNIGGKANVASRSGDNVLSRQLNNLRTQFRDAITNEVPAYGRALDAFSDESNMLDALDLGRRFIRDDADITRRVLQEMPAGEREMFLIGATRQIMDQVNTASNPGTAVRRLIGSADRREKIAALFENRTAFNAFRRALINEGRFLRTRNVVAGGSPTQRIEAEQVDLAGPITDAASGEPSTALAIRLLNRMTNRLPSERVSAELGDILLRPDPVQNQAVLNALRGGRFGSQELAEIIGRRALGATGAASAVQPAIGNR